MSPVRGGAGLCACLLGMSLLAACGPASRPADRTAKSLPPATTEYSVRVSDGLDRLEVELCFGGQPPEALRPGNSAALRHLLDLRVVHRPGRSGGQVTRTGQRLSLRGLGPGDCVAYTFDLAGLTASGGRGMRRAEGAVTVPTTHWLLGASPRDRVGEAWLRFELPEGMVASLPCARRGGRYRIDESVFRMLGHTAIGHLQVRRLDLELAQVELLQMPGELAMGQPEIDAWIGQVVAAVATLYGRAPVDRLRVVVQPVAAEGRPVAFGQFTRGGGASVLLLLRADATLAALSSDWVSVHELAHSALPYVRRQDAWLSEGIATYYQEVLRARAGLQSPLDAWRALDDGFRRGRQKGTGRSMRQESVDMYRTFAFEPVYWFGTAYALIVDAELRARDGSTGPSSLDAVLDALRRCCMPSNDIWSSQELLGRLDRELAEPAFVARADRLLDSREFPGLERLYRFLGLVRGTDGLVLLDDSAEGASIRQAIMAGSGG